MNRRTETPEDRLQGNPAKQPLTEPAKGVYERILLGVDFSPTSTPVYEHALKLARQNHAELLLMHAYDIPKTVSFMPPDSYEQWLTDYHNHAADQMKRLVNQAREEGVRCHALILAGLPEDAIAAAVQKAKMDLVVIGTHGRHGLSRLLAGSIASRITPRAGCPVLTIHVAS